MDKGHNLREDNHYIPKMYQRRWSKNGIEIFEYLLIVSHPNVPIWNQAKIKSAARIKGLYIFLDQGNESDSVEQWFDSKFENPTAPILDKVCKDQQLTPDEWDQLMLYILSQYVRTPAFCGWIKMNFKDVIDRVGENLANELSGFSPDDLQNPSGIKNSSLNPISVAYQEVDDTVCVRIPIGQKLWLFMCQYFLREGSPVILQMKKMNWCVISLMNAIPTSDQPVVIARKAEDGRYELKSTLDGEDTVLLFPISPYRVLYADYTGQFGSKMIADDKLASIIKELIVKNALWRVFALEEDEEIPNIRPRIVDSDIYKTISDGCLNWQSSYRTEECV